MFSLTIVFGDSPSTSWAFTYREEATAKLALASFKPDEQTVIVDDFNQAATFRPGTIRAYNLEDLEQTALAASEREIIRMKGYAALGTKIDGTPELKNALNKARTAMMQQQILGGGMPGPRPNA